MGITHAKEKKKAQNKKKNNKNKRKQSKTNKWVFTEREWFSWF